MRHTLAPTEEAADRATMKLARGFCDLNISATDTDLRQTVLKALSVGYQTLALNRHVTDTSTATAGGGGGGGKKKKKGTGEGLTGRLTDRSKG